MSLFTQLWGWLTEPAQNRQGLTDGAIEEAENCGPRHARAALASEQAELALELERLFMAYDEKVQDLALRLKDLKPNAAEAEVARLRAIQHELQAAVRRLEAAAKSRQELENELSYWQKMLGGEVSSREKARRQTEIIRSELAIRSPEDDFSMRLEQIPQSKFQAIETPVFAVEQITSESDSFPAEHPELGMEVPDYAHWPDAENLVRAIREATREAERWHAIPVECHDEEAMIQVRHVRDLNAWLKRVDRRNGVTRDRLELAISPRELKY
jgi:multidrug efflux pump subunit AcrA (membrane-fusion protein)